MKKNYLCVFSIIFFLLSNVYSVKAQHYNAYSRRFRTKSIKTHSGEIDLKLLNFTYKEPDGGVKDEGKMSGIGVAYAYHNDLMTKAALNYYTGKIDYESDSGKLNDVNHYILELRWLIGHDLPRSNYYIIPYTGFGYRYWKDTSGGKVTDLGYYGYDRETTYFYIPLGLETFKWSENKWFIGAVIEFDLFLKGKNKSHLSDVDPDAPDLEFNQDSGYGLRFDFKVEKAIDRVKIGIVPFFHYWDIDKSEELAFFDPSEGGYWIFYEPKNNTTEFGARLSVKF